MDYASGLVPKNSFQGHKKSFTSRQTTKKSKARILNPGLLILEDLSKGDFGLKNYTKEKSGVDKGAPCEKSFAVETPLCSTGS